MFTDSKRFLLSLRNYLRHSAITEKLNDKSMLEIKIMMDVHFSPFNVFAFKPRTPALRQEYERTHGDFPPSDFYPKTDPVWQKLNVLPKKIAEPGLFDYIVPATEFIGAGTATAALLTATNQQWDSLDGLTFPGAILGTAACFTLCMKAGRLGGDKVSDDPLKFMAQVLEGLIMALAFGIPISATGSIAAASLAAHFFANTNF